MLRLVCGAVLLAGFPVLAGAQSADAPFPLSEALAAAAARAPELAAAVARVEAARLAQPLAGRPPNPLVELRSENWPNAAPAPGMPLDLFATVTQTIELGGKRAARRAAADAALDNAGALRSVVDRTVALEVVGLYLDALRAAERARLLSDYQARLTEATRVVRRRVEVGTAAESELLKLLTEEARVDLDAARSRLDASRSATLLSARVGTSIGVARLRMPDLPPVPASGDDEVADNAEVRLARTAADAAARSLAIERSRTVPDIALNTGLKRTMGYNTGVVAVTVPVPIFDRNGVARAVAVGQWRAASFEADAVALRVRGELAAFRDAAVTLTVRAATLNGDLVEPARAARDASRAAFAAGALDVLRLLDAERAFADAVAVAIDVRVAAVSAAIDARLAAGEVPLP